MFIKTHNFQKTLVKKYVVLVFESSLISRLFRKQKQIKQSRKTRLHRHGFQPQKSGKSRLKTLVKATN